jgi:hypothetical protein
MFIIKITLLNLYRGELNENYNNLNQNQNQNLNKNKNKNKNHRIQIKEIIHALKT